jgi:hypothetical protein
VLLPGCSAGGAYPGGARRRQTRGLGPLLERGEGVVVVVVGDILVVLVVVVLVVLVVILVVVVVVLLLLLLLVAWDMCWREVREGSIGFDMILGRIYIYVLFYDMSSIVTKHNNTNDTIYIYIYRCMVWQIALWRAPWIPTWPAGRREAQ